MKKLNLLLANIFIVTTGYSQREILYTSDGGQTWTNQFREKQQLFPFYGINDSN